MEQGQWDIGSAGIGGADHRGWIVGAFMDQGDVRTTPAVEIRCGTHPPGGQRANWSDCQQRTSSLMLVSGCSRIDPPDVSHVPTRPGDYAVGRPGIGHPWEAEEDSVVVTVRWPARG